MIPPNRLASNPDLHQTLLVTSISCTLATDHSARVVWSPADGHGWRWKLLLTCPS